MAKKMKIQKLFFNTCYEYFNEMIENIDELVLDEFDDNEKQTFYIKLEMIRRGINGSKQGVNKIRD